ncbi:MAG: trehalase family glycosidase [Prevotellaceae bacterium]|nr:trehalase family glycosidase [Prevotellaceae bacterium]
MTKTTICLAFLMGVATIAYAQDKDDYKTAVAHKPHDEVHYTGTTIATPARHDGGLKPVVGVHNIQIMRGAKPWTYNHQPFLAYWKGQFWLHYLTNPRSEHEAPGRTMIMHSRDGYNWSEPAVLFPEYNVPDGITKPAYPGLVSKGLKAVMHQRVGFYVSKSGRLLATGNYGIVLAPKDDPNDGNGIGRVVREIKSDGGFGNIYFIYYNHGFNESNTSYPFYKSAKDKEFVKAVDEMVADPMQRMQWVEEADRNDDVLPLKAPYKAFCGYTLPDGRKVALWKHAVTSISTDGGNTWQYPCERAYGFVNSNAKIWGQRLTDGTYATVYNPAEYRWPLAISLSNDGLEYTTLSLIHGDVTPERHGGNYKSFGPQYTRGIQEGNGVPEDGNLWVTYSHNKEDMWVSRIQVPVKLDATEHARGCFCNYKTLAEMADWNIYSPLWAPVSLDGDWLKLEDKDPYDYAKVEKVIPATKELQVEFDLKANQKDFGALHIEFLNEKGDVASRIIADSTGNFLAKGGARSGSIIKNYEVGKVYHIKAILSTKLHRAYYYVDGKLRCKRQFDTPVDDICRVQFRTGALFDKPDIETPADQYTDMPRADEQDRLASYEFANFTTSSLDADASAAVLKYDSFAHYADYFNNMEDENIVGYIPNSQASEWMKENIPLFDCPQENFREMYYYRWWSFRKHIEKTPQGYGITEFLVRRSYADRYNLIACAIGHHVMEGRWLHNPEYIQQNLNIWYHGKDGQPLPKMEKFSSWNPAAIYEAWKVLENTVFVDSMLPALENEYAKWKTTHSLENGLFWQFDVRDGMEESISGARKKQNARPTINSYMYGNAKALADFYQIKGDKAKVKEYNKEAERVKGMVESRLWNPQHEFFETLTADSSANVREAIGFIPWYFNLPEAKKYDNAWLQTNDEKGFSAPYGLTTAERRHPQFRSHGVGTCEWDGAIWPFATSQTLTAMANYLNDYPSPVITDSTYFRQMELYVESQHHRGRPYIGEYLDEKNGAWLMGDKERSRYYNHSTFADLIITGLVGIRPQADKSVVVNPLVPKYKWNYFCLDAVNYKGHMLTVIWDKDGTRYHQGKGLILLVDGKRAAQRKDLGKITYKL